MRAAVLEANASSAVLADVELAIPLPREVVVRTVAAGVCHTDLSALEGAFNFRKPMVMGHEGAGIVEAVGAGVTSVRPGDRVVTTLSDFCGRCRYCISGRPYLCRQMSRGRPPSAPPRITRGNLAVAPFCGVGSFAEQILLNENAVARVGDEIGLDKAALLGCRALTGLGAVFRTAKVEVGDTVAVLGCGGVGLSIIQGARIAGATRIIAIDPIESKRDLAIRLGATDTIGADACTVVEMVRELSSGGVDHAFESAGRKETIEQAVAMTGRGGTATIVGSPGDIEVRLSVAELMIDRRIQGSWMGSNRFQVDVPTYVQLYLQGRLLLDELVSTRLKLEELELAWSAFHNGGGGRSVIIFE
ncbi:Zn-dependent alcohol dehydrogenase [Rhodococcus sp. NM-2]|uniref:Zn-dependent alcohol dehydrogenase n=1 Tax=Rhodococcus sp. NM-2 TaxID=3401174 RepID=UPI003AAE1964